MINNKPIPETNHMKGADEFEKGWNEFLNTEAENTLNEMRGVSNERENRENE